MKVPDWLDETAKGFWRQHVKHVHLTDRNRETFAMLCQCYSDYRQAQDYRSKKLALDYYYKLCKEYGLTPKSEKTLPHDEGEVEFFT